MYKTEILTGDTAGKRQKRYVDSPKSKSKTCLINKPGNFYDEYKILGDFSAKYAKCEPTKDHGNHPILKEKLIGC